MRQATRVTSEPSAGVLRSVLALTDDGVVLCDTDGSAVEMNDAAATLLGWTASSALGRRFEEIIERARPSDGRGLPIAGDELVRRAAASPLGARAHLRPGRRERSRPVRISTAPATEGGRVFLLRDLNALAAAEDAAHLYKRTADAALDAIYLADADTLSIVYANEGAARQSGWPTERLIGRPLGELVPLLDLGRHEPSTVPTVLRGRSGDLRPVDVLVRPLEIDSNEPHVLVVVRDATERVEAQAKLQRLVQQERARTAELEATLAAIGDAVVVCDVEGAVTLANPATHDILGRARIHTYGDLVALLEEPDRAPRLGAASAVGPVEVRLRGRTERWLEVSAFPVVGPPDEPPSGTIFLLRDVTGARETRRMREAFLGILSHELRTPVTTILAGSKVLGRRQHLPEAVRSELIEDIEAEAERLYRLVEDLLVLARFEEQPADGFANEPLLLQRLLPTLISSEEARWPGRAFTLTIPTGLPTVNGDRTYVDQVVRNLLGNAAKYSNVDEAIEVAVDESAGRVRVRILDRGPGFEAAEAERLFDLYYRSPGTLGIAAGAGIGLFVCRRLIEAMDGEIWAQPRPGGGAEFGFALHVLDEEEA